MSDNKNQYPSHLDPNQIQIKVFDESIDANRVSIVNWDKMPVVSCGCGPNHKHGEQNEVIKALMSSWKPADPVRIEVPVIVKQPEFKEIQVPIVTKEIQYERIEVPIVVKQVEFKEIEKIVFQERVIFPMWAKAMLIMQSLAAVGMLLVQLIK